MMKAKFLSRLKSFRKDPRGVSAVEFAIIFPVMAALFLGSTAAGQAIALNRKLTLLARSTSDLVAQGTALTTADVNNIFDASIAIIYPYSTTPVKIVVTQVWVNSSGTATVDWSQTRNGTALTAGSSYTLPTNMAVNSSSVIVTDVTYAYATPFGQAFIGSTINMAEKVYMRPRETNRITKS